MDPSNGRRLIAAFDDADSAREVVADLRDHGVDPAAIRLDDPDDRSVLARQAQRWESSSVAAAPGVVGERRTLIGMLVMTALWGGLGALLGALVGWLVDLGGMSEVAEVALVAVVGALALGTAGFVYGLGRGPDAVKGPRPDPHQAIISVASTTDDAIDLIRRGHPDSMWEIDETDLRAEHDHRVGRAP